MGRGLAAALALWMTFWMTFWAGDAVACPGLGFLGDEITLTARQLATPRSAAVRAGGTVPLGQCRDLPGVGNLPFDPSVSILYLPDAKPRDLDLRAEGGCDPVLLARGPSGRFFFDDDDDDGGAQAARIRLARPPAGRYTIWVGSRAGVACPARLTLRTLPAARR